MTDIGCKNHRLGRSDLAINNVWEVIKISQLACQKPIWCRDSFITFVYAVPISLKGTWAG